jgi:anti-anti-sigma factor
MPQIRIDPGLKGLFFVAGELDALSAQDFDAGIAACLYGDGAVVLDLGDLTFVDSTGIRSFVRLANHLRPRALVLRNPSGTILQALEIYGLASAGVTIEDGGPREGRTDGPGAWSRWAALRHSHDALVARHAALAERCSSLVRACASAWRRAGTARDEARRLRIGVPPP